MKDLRIVLTGGIASGKTAVTEYLRAKGFAVIDADLVSRELTEKGSPVLAEIAKQFGDSVMASDGSLNRAHMRELITAFESKREELNRMLHARIYDMMQERLDASVGNTVVAVPLYFDTPYRLRGADEVWTVSAPTEERIKRLCLRDNNSEEQAKRLIACQASDELREKMSTRILHNDGDMESLYRQVDGILESLS